MWFRSIRFIFMASNTRTSDEIKAGKHVHFEEDECSLFDQKQAHTISTINNHVLICILVKNSSITANFICIYRPTGCVNMFFDEFPNFLENTLQFQDELYIFGNFNIHLDKPSVNTRSFLDILDTFSLHQHVTFPTHIYGHWLDLFITRSNCKSCIFFWWFIWSPNGTYWCMAPN